MNAYEIEKLEETFHIKAIQTRGNQKGVILKFPCFYLKIYDGKGDTTYSVQVWRYNKQLPFIVKEVRCNELVSFVKNL